MPSTPAPHIGTPSQTVPPTPLLRTREDAPALEMLGVRIRFLVSADETAGAWSLLEYTAPASFAGPAPHYHGSTTELFYVLEGNLTLEANGTSQVLTPGGLALVPPAVTHRFSNPAPEPCRFLIQLSPAGVEGYFAEMAKLIRNAPAWPLPDMRSVVALAEQYDTFAPTS